MATEFSTARALLVLGLTWAPFLSLSNAQSVTPTTAPSLSPTLGPTVAVNNICGDCWCVPEGGTGNGDCPAMYPGLIQTIPGNYAGFYQSMTLGDGATERPLQDANGNSDCYPFQEALGASQTYPQSEWPQCQRYDNGDEPDAVCAFVYQDVTEQCRGRSYEAMTYANATEAKLAAAMSGNENKVVHIAHKGACGVCSNAQDYAARLESLDIINGLMVLCATDYTAKPNKNEAWTDLIQCIQRGISFTDPCATLWAHFAATNAAKCALECVTNEEGDIELNGGPPTCPLSDCLKCSADLFEQDFNAIAGLWKSPYNAGVVDEIVYPCSVFYRVESHDPCIGAPEVEEEPTQSPTDDTSHAFRQHDQLGDKRNVAALVMVSLGLLPLAMFL